MLKQPPSRLNQIALTESQQRKNSMSFHDLAIWFLIFLTYAIIGWCLEVTVSFVRQHHAINRGFLIGPVCPIYGFGAMIMALLLRDVDNILEIFIVSFFAGGVLEYLTSFVMEKMFRVRWWDYSSEPFNIHGRVCLHYLIAFGVLGILVIRVINPALLSVYSLMNSALCIILAAVLFVILLTDFITSIFLINKFRITVGIVQRDATEEITAKVREIIMDRGKLSRRLAKAFPSMKAKKKVACKKSTKRKISTNKTKTATGAKTDQRTA